MEFGMDSNRVFTIAQAELVLNFEETLEKIRNGRSPTHVLCDNHENVVVFEWEDYWNRYTDVLPSGERARIEAECRKRGDPS